MHRIKTVTVDGEEVTWYSVPHFVNEMTNGAVRWLQRFGSTQTVSRNMEKFAHYRPEGLPPHVAGPVVA